MNAKLTILLLLFLLSIVTTLTDHDTTIGNNYMYYNYFYVTENDINGML